MTKHEAIAAMKKGAKVTHIFFTNDEFITMRDGYIITEEGIEIAPVYFWDLRIGVDWEGGWSIYK